MTDMTAIYILEWTFTPTDYFEEPVDFVCGHGSIHVENGKAETRVPANLYPLDHSLRTHLHGELDARFLAAQILSHKPYELSKPSLSNLHRDGRKDVWVFPNAATMVISGGVADIVQKDAAGNVIRDTKRERIDRRIGFAQLAARYFNDAVAYALFGSYSASVNDPSNELVHLYEIRDALSRHLGGEAPATSAVNITRAEWSRLGHLSNDEPFTQGRHRGKRLGSLREATAAELSEARVIARKMIEGYLRHLHSGTRSQD
jgi:hypothetical protein